MAGLREDFAAAYSCRMARFCCQRALCRLGAFPACARRPERFFLHVVCCQRSLHSAVLIFIGFCRLMMELGMGCMNTFVKQRRMAVCFLRLLILAELQAGCAAIAPLFHQCLPSLCCIR